MVEKGMSCVKYLLFVFNLIFFLIGAALIGVGAYVQIKLNEYLDFFQGQPVNAPAIVIIVVGALTLIIGFFGCCGAIKENNCMVMTFAVLISLIFIIEIAGGIAGFVMKGKVNEYISKGMMASMENYNGTDHGGVTKVWDNTQKEFKCCGTKNQTDWGTHIPKSCCSDGKDCKESAGYYSEGCLTQIEKFLTDRIGIVAGVAVGLAVVELLGIIFACCLGRAIRNEHSYA